MNQVFKKSFYSNAKKEIIIKMIEVELKNWEVDNISIKDNKVEFSFNSLKLGSTFTIYRKIDRGFFEIDEESNQTLVRYFGLNSINVDIFVIIICLLMSVIVSWFFLFILTLFFIQLASRISKLNNIQDEMINRLSNEGNG